MYVFTYLVKPITGSFGGTGMEKQIRVDAALLLRLIGQQFGGLPLPSGKRQNAKKTK